MNARSAWSSSSTALEARTGGTALTVPHCNGCTSGALHRIHCSECTAADALQRVHWNRYTATDALQRVHYIQCIAPDTFHGMHCFGYNDIENVSILHNNMNFKVYSKKYAIKLNNTKSTSHVYALEHVNL